MITHGRKKPYTEIGIRRLRCARLGCTNMAVHQWSACSDDNLQRPLCNECDYAINAIVMSFMQVPDWRSKLYSYRRRLELDEGAVRKILKRVRECVSANCWP